MAAVAAIVAKVHSNVSGKQPGFEQLHSFVADVAILLSTSLLSTFATICLIAELFFVLCVAPRIVHPAVGWFLCSAHTNFLLSLILNVQRCLYAYAYERLQTTAALYDHVARAAAAVDTVSIIDDKRRQQDIQPPQHGAKATLNGASATATRQSAIDGGDHKRRDRLSRRALQR